MKRKFGNLLMVATLVLAVGSFFTSCKDYDEELQAEMYAQVIDQINDELGADVADLKETVDAILPTVQADINGLESVIAALEARVAELEALNHDHSNFATKEELAAAKAELEAAQKELDAAIKELADKMATKEALEGVAASLNDLKGEFATHVELFNALSNTVTEALGRLTTLEGEYEALDARVKAIEDAKYQEQIDAIKGDLGKVVKQAAEADARSKANETAIEALETYNVEFAQAVKDSVAALRAEAAANLAEAKAYAAEAAAAVAAELAKTNATVVELQAAFAEAVAELQDQIDVLAEELDELKDDLAAIEEALGLLQDEVDDMRKDMNEQISGIVLNGAYSPVVGYFALPTGVKSNILAAYYGEVDTDFYFPTLRTANNVGAAFDADFEALGFVEEKTEAGVLIASNGNAGKVYMTINPAEVSLEGKQFALVNSLGEVSPAVLSVPVKSDMKLNFGYTRNEAVALYEAEATIAAEDVEAAKIRIELSELKDALKAIVSVGDGVNVTDLISKLYAIVNDIADANAIKATWTDSKGEAHTVYSDYGLAAVAVKPLSYNFLADLNITSVPSYHKGVSLVNKIFDKVGSVDLPDLGLSDLSATLESITLGDVIGDEVVFNINASVTIEGEVYPIQDEVRLPSSEVFGDLDASLENLDSFLKQVNDLLGSFNGKIEAVESVLSAALDNVQNELNDYLSALNNKICGMINSFNAVLQPTMLVSTTDGFSMLSSIKGAPTTIDNASAVLVPTSFTAEVLAPACKKFVAVTNAYKDGQEDLAEAKAANTGDLATVLPGSTRAVQFNGKSGYTYEITYSAVDFYGMISNTKYYVKVK